MTPKSASQARDWSITRRATLGLALAAALPLTVGGRIREVAAEAAPDTWMYAGNPARTGAFPGPGLDLTKEITELWRIDLSESGFFIDPCGVCDDIAYYLPVPDGISDAIRPLVAVDAKTGSELWRHDPPVTDPASFFWGEPAIADGLLVIATYSGLLVGIDAKTGEERWIFDLQGKANNPRPAILDGVVYVSDNASVNAVKLGETPDWVWKTALADGTESVVSPTVSVDGDYVVVSSVSPVPCSDPELKVTDIHVLNITDGAEAYRFRFSENGESYQFALQDGVLYSRSDKMSPRSYLFAMSIDGTVLWSSRTVAPTDIFPYPITDGELVFVIASALVSGNDPATGETTWQGPPQMPLLDSDMVLIDDVIYIGGAPPTPTVYALSAKDGSLLKAIPVPFDGAQVIGITNGVLIVRAGTNLVALHAASS